MDKKATFVQLAEQIEKINSVYEKVHKQEEEIITYAEDYNKEKEKLFTRKYGAKYIKHMS
ncbi:YkyA family protein [Bacillus inaquosorum]|uniref:Uncharacterized protein n=1 Tax=Bacillus inaquosorum KCTC 13429 TaxID=1236548 RepID=A0A9W5PDF4_9BACI|nr:YkyA family protein [Bacillus inaquosorum]ELS61773.1 hypothetical protein BSI_21460 [Bacillus inaquosorum KCTC 13429]